MLSNFFIIPVVREKIRVKRAPAIPTGAPTTLTEDTYFYLKQLKLYLCNQKQQHIYLIFYYIIFFDLFLGLNHFQSCLFHLV